MGGLDLEVYLDRLLRATTKKRSPTFLTTKSALPDKILATISYDCSVCMFCVKSQFVKVTQLRSFADSLCDEQKKKSWAGKGSRPSE